MAQMGRPRKEINKEEFEKLCGLQCTKEEICGWFDVTDKTVDAFARREYNTTFSDIYEKKRETGKISLRRSQFRLAERSAAMAIWLGKQYLGQREPETTTDATAGGQAEEWKAAILSIAEQRKNDARIK